MDFLAVDPADYPDAAEIRASGNESIVLSTDFKVQDISISQGKA